MIHTIPLGTHVAFDGEPGVYVVDQYQTLLYCEQPCPILHESDCFHEPYIHVKVEQWLSLPLSKLRFIFDPVTHVGRAPTQAELTPVKTTL